MEDPLGAPNTVVVASATTIIFFACLPIQLAALTKFTVFFFMFTTSLARKSEPEVVFFSRFRQRVTTSTSLSRKSEPERVFFHVSPACHHLHLPRMQKRAGGGCFLVFHLHVTTTTSLARKSEPEVVFFSRFIRMSPPPPPSHAKASRRWCFFTSTATSSPTPPRHHLRRPYPHTKHPTRRIGG